MALTVEQVLAKELLANAGVAALVAGRIHPQAAPQGSAPPYVTYVASTVPQHDHSGSGGLSRVWMSFSCHGVTYAQAKAVAAAIGTALGGRQGAMQGEVVQGILELETVDAGWDEVTKLHVVDIEFRVWF